GLDLLGDRDFFLAGEQRNAAHLLEVHADRVGGLAGRAVGGLFLFRRLLGGPLGLDRLLRGFFAVGNRRFFGDVLHVDVDLAQHRDYLVDLLGASRLTAAVGIARAGGAPDARFACWTGWFVFVGSLVVALHDM